MKLHTFRAPLVAVLCGLSLTLGAARLHAEQFEMDRAIEQLEKAKHDDNHVEHLEKAKLHLEEARHNKHGERAEAIREINEAIDEARRGHFRRMEEHINSAIHEVREGRR